MVLHLHRAERADRLVAALAEVLRTPLDDPMAAEIVSVPTRGVERWVAQQLSTTLGASGRGHDGVCANVDFPFPARLVDVALAAGAVSADQAAIWRPERLVWPLVEVVEACLGEPWLSTLASYVRGGPGASNGASPGAPPDKGPGDRRFGAVRHIADLYDRYSVQRPDMLRAWARGDDVDERGAPLPDDCGWQAELWRRVRDHVGTPSPAEVLHDVCDRLRQDPSQVELPARLSLFGVTRVPASHAEVLRSLAGGRDVHLFALHPSPELWEDVGRLPVRALPILRRHDPSAEAARNPLLASWGRDAREMQLVLTAGTGDPVDDRHHAVTERPTTLLARIQNDVRANLVPPGVPVVGTGAGGDGRPTLRDDDRSLTVHSCHGRARQVEVVRDAVLHLLVDDPTLQPRDVIVMCPDIETFAPLVHATFGAGTDPADDEGAPPFPPPARAPAAARTDTTARTAGGDGVDGRPTDLRVRLADRSLRQTNPVLGVVAELLDLADARLTASQVIDLASRGPVRARFGLDDDDLARLERWVDVAGIRWGLDAAHRGPYGLGDLDANTWRAGLDRLLLGAAMTEDDLPLVGGVLPLDDVDSGDLDLAGRVAELIERLGAVIDAFGRSQSVVAWADAIAAAGAALTATAAGDDWQAGELRGLLDDLIDEATVRGQPADGTLQLPEVRTLLSDRLRGRATRANFRTGHLTVCTLVPMRSVPHRVVCLLGLDDGLFPRPGASDGDDLVERAPCVGDRDARSEDRQLLLDAVMAATDALVITYSGRDPRTNAPLPPAVPLGELLDVVDATVRADDGRAARHHITVRHPLQPFDARNFSDRALGRPGPWSFDPFNLEGARAMRRPRSPAAAMLDGPLPAQPRDTIGLDDLIRFVQHPVRAFFRQRLGVSLTDRSDDVDDALPVDLDGLGRWGIGDRMLGARLKGTPPETCRAAEVARGALPPGALGDAVIARVGPTVERLVAVAARYESPLPPDDPAADPDDPDDPDTVVEAAARASIDVAVDLGRGEAVAGTVTGLVGPVAVRVTYSTVRARQRLEAWVRLLALSAARPEVAWEVVTIGPRRQAVGVTTVGPLPGGPTARAVSARAHLGVLVDLYRRGMTHPLPLYCETSAAWAAAVRDGRDPVAAAGREWSTIPSDPSWEREDRDADHGAALDGIVAFETLLEALPGPDEDGPGWPADQATRLGRYAVRLWDGLLAHERTESS